MDPLRPGSELQKLDLSDKDWEQYLRRIRKPKAGHDLRHNRRHKKIVQCVLRVDQGAASQVYVIHSRDIGAGGMGFMHHDPLPPAAHCVIVLETNAGHGHVIHGRVRWSREVGGGLFAIGVGFDRALDLHEFVDVAESGAHDAGGEACAA